MFQVIHDAKKRRQTIGWLHLKGLGRMVDPAAVQRVGGFRRGCNDGLTSAPSLHWLGESGYALVAERSRFELVCQ